MFDAIAARYDLLNHTLSAGIDRWWRRRAIDSLRLAGHERVLDMCTGTADVAVAAARRVATRGHVIGVDFSHEMLRVAAAKIESAGLGNTISLVRGDATCIPVRDESVDVLTIAFGIRNVERPDRACREFARVLRPRGRLAVLEFALPTAPLVRAVYLTYFQHVLPRIGRALSGHQTAYGYLPASVNTFATPEEFVKLLRQSGFLDVRAVPLTFGTVFLYTGSRV